jgi:hypothetical protein
MKPVVKVYLVPTNWNENPLQALHTSVVGAMIGFNNIESEDDFLTLFPTDLMQKGLGTEIHVEIDVPDQIRSYTEYDTRIAEKVGRAIREHLPAAYVQCKVYKYQPDEGSWQSR